MDLLKNQIDYFIDKANEEIDKILSGIERGDISKIDGKNAMSRLEGKLYSLKEVINSDNRDDKIREIMNSNMLLKDNIARKIKFTNKKDPNIGLFHYYCGIVDTMLILITIPSNPLSACPLNKDYLLSKSLDSLKEELKDCKDTTKKKDIKISIKITEELYNKNLKYLKK